MVTFWISLRMSRNYFTLTNTRCSRRFRFIHSFSGLDFVFILFYSIFFFLFSCFRAVLPNFASPPDWKSVVCVVCLPFAGSVDCHLVANSSANRFAGKQIEKMLLCLFHTRSNATILVGISARLSIGSIQSNLMIDFAFERKRDANKTKNKRIYCRFSFKRISHEDEFPWFLFLITNFELMVFCFFVIFVTTHENWKAIRMRYPITKCFERGACMETAGWFAGVRLSHCVALRENHHLTVSNWTFFWRFDLDSVHLETSISVRAMLFYWYEGGFGLRWGFRGGTHLEEFLVGKNQSLL